MARLPDRPLNGRIPIHYRGDRVCGGSGKSMRSFPPVGGTTIKRCPDCTKPYTVYVRELHTTVPNPLNKGRVEWSELSDDRPGIAH